MDPIEPSTRVVRRNDAVVRFGGWAARAVARPLVAHAEVEGRLPEGPCLVLMNHTNVLDPILLTAYSRRPIQFLITEPAMHLGIAGRLASWWGQVPKKKLDADTRSFRMLKGWCRAGGAVGLFPEGQMTWDGHPLPVRAGLRQLVSFLEVPVVTVRLFNGDRLWPSWAKVPRRTTLRFEIDPPRRFERGEDVERIVADRLRVDPDTSPRWPVRGRRLAEGLARFLRYCPACGNGDVLREYGDVLACTSCGAGFTVTGENRLISRAGAMSIAEALRAAERHADEHWRRSEQVESRGEVHVLDLAPKMPALLATGPLCLEGRMLRVAGWELAMDDVVAHMLDWDERLLLRTERRRFALRMPHDSRALWSHVFDRTMRSASADATAEHRH